MSERKITIEVLLTGRAGELVFVPITGTKKEIVELLGKEKNEIIKHSIEKELKERRIKL